MTQKITDLMKGTDNDRRNLFYKFGE
jgi:hypothetical protein